MGEESRWRADRCSSWLGNSSSRGTPLAVFLLGAAVLMACEEKTPGQSAREAGRKDSAAAVASEIGAATPNVDPRGAEGEQRPAPLSCPSGMVLVPGGPFWVGAEFESFNQEENPRFLTQVAPYCLDVTEVTTAAYAECVQAGACTPARTEYKTCNAEREGRENHPINCVDHGQAESYCAWRKARLPTEIEWEFAARGGAEQRKYPWGNESPDGHTCWKKPHSCPVKSFPAGAFGLYDITGNVWEWTADWFGTYPWPEENGQHRVYRGGSWSRRFEKWLRPTLRNRYRPDHWGSHLGMRCAVSPEGRECPYGVDKKAVTGCQHGVDDARCLDGKRWNGARCAAPGAPRCPDDSEFVPGRGCASQRVPPASTANVSVTAPAPTSAELDVTEVRRRRSPEFDEDCAQNQPTRPHAYRYENGSHAARNAVGRRDGCKNRDVGVGWNSACCP